RAAVPAPTAAAPATANMLAVRTKVPKLRVAPSRPDLNRRRLSSPFRSNPSRATSSSTTIAVLPFSVAARLRCYGLFQVHGFVQISEIVDGENGAEVDDGTEWR